MGISKEDAVKALQTREQFFVAYSQATKLPYVTCADETYNDQAWVFSTEDEIKEFGKKLLQEKVLLMGMKYEKKDFARFYGILYAIGVNAVVWNEGEDQVEVEIENIARQADLSKIEPAKRPLFNPSLQLSGIYFMQELRRPVKKEERQNMREMEEEVLANLVKSEFLLPMAVNEEDPSKVNVPYLKNKEGKILQPFFTDIMEYEKFAKGKKMRAAKVPFTKLPELLMEQASGFALNPLGFNLVLDKEQLKRILGR